MQMQEDIEVGAACKVFEREGRFLKSCNHPNIVQYLSTAKTPHSTLLVLELMDCDLKSYISGFGNDPLPSDCEISLSKDMACGLAFIHSKKILHRDLCVCNRIWAIALASFFVQL